MTASTKPATRKRGDPSTNGHDDRVPPHDLDAEASLLGSCLLASSAVEILVAETRISDFYAPGNQHVAEAIRALAGRQVDVNAVTVADELRHAGLLDVVGGVARLSELQNVLPPVSAATHFARIIADAGARRDLIALSGELADVGFSLRDDPAAAVAQVRLMLDRIPTSAGTARVCPIDLVDWSDVYAGTADELVHIEGLAHPGRWTAVVADAKAGKSTLLVCAFCALSRGVDPFDQTPRVPVGVLYVDAEMGRVDIHERLEALGLHPGELDRFHYSDLPPRLDTIEGGQALVAAALNLEVGTVVIDGINGVVSGPEKDDTTWRLLYDCTIAPLKRAGLAITTSDNLGKDRTRGARGSSVKTDKADGIVLLTRTSGGVKLTTTHRRTFAYPTESLLSVSGLDGSEPITFRRTETAWPTGTADAIELLEQLEIPIDAGRTKARVLINVAKQAAQDAGDTFAAERFRVRNDALGAAIRYRKSAGTGANRDHRQPARDRTGDSLPGFDQ